MTQTWDCAETRISLGVYVLGAIDPAERAQVDAHLSTCRDCRDELAGLAGIPALLARVNADELSRLGTEEADTAPAEAPPELVGTVLDLAAARKRRSIWRYAAAAAAVVVVAGGLFGGLRTTSSPDGFSASQIPFTPGHAEWEWIDGQNQGLSASTTIAYAQENWGTAVAAKTEGIPWGTTCELWVVHPDGSRTYINSWMTASDEGTVWYWGGVPKGMGTISRFQITQGNKVLVTTGLVS